VRLFSAPHFLAYSNGKRATVAVEKATLGEQALAALESTPEVGVKPRPVAAPVLPGYAAALNPSIAPGRIQDDDSSDIDAILAAVGNT